MYIKLKSKSNINLSRYDSKKSPYNSLHKDRPITTRQIAIQQKIQVPHLQRLSPANKIKSISQSKIIGYRISSKEKYSNLQNYKNRKLEESPQNKLFINQSANIAKESQGYNMSKLLKYQTSKNSNSTSKFNFFKSKINQIQIQQNNDHLDFIQSKQLSTRSNKIKSQNDRLKYNLKPDIQTSKSKNIQVNKGKRGTILTLKNTKPMQASTSYMYSNFKSKKNQTLQQRNKRRADIAKNSSIKQPTISMNDFVKLKKLGQGQNGNIYSVYYKPLRAIFAIKHFKPQKMVLDYLIDEMKIQLFCNNQHILPAYGFIIQAEASSILNKKEKEDINVYLIMEKGQQNLFSVIHKKGKLNQQKIADYTRQILLGLKYLHDNKIIHRDIKPENIILVNNTVKITDFGWSTLHSEERQTFCGTLEYISPEIAFGQVYTKKIDCWSVGILMYQMLTGQAPFNKDKIISHPNYQFKKNLIKNIPKGTSQQCKELLKCFLKVNPNQRISIQQALNHPWIQNYRKTVTVDEGAFQKQVRQKLNMQSMKFEDIFNLTQTIQNKKQTIFW